MFKHKYGKKRSNPKAKKCAKCGRMRVIGNFAKDKYKKDGLTTMCKSCISAKNKTDYDHRKITNPKRRKMRATIEEVGGLRAI